MKELSGVRLYTKALQDAGAGLLLGTDHVFGSGGALQGAGQAMSRVGRELRELVDAGLTPYQALSTGTTNVARYFETQAEGGTVATGERADLVLLTEDPLADVAAVNAIAGVMIGGRWLPKDDMERQLRAIR